MSRGPNHPYRFEKSELHQSVADKVLRTDTFQYRDQDYEFGVLDPSVAPVHFVVGMPNGQNLIASSEIPPNLLPFYLGHEIQCNRLRAGQDGRCASIESGLIQEATEETLRELLKARRQTFEDLVTVYEIDLANPADPFRKEIAGTTLFLRQKMKELRMESE